MHAAYKTVLQSMVKYTQTAASSANSLVHAIMARLPPEIFIIIIGELRYDRKAIANCTLVSNAWLQSARRWSFTNDIFLYGHPNAANDGFFELLSAKNSTIAPFITRIRVGGPEEDEFPTPDQPNQATRRSYEYIDGICLDHLSRLTNLRHMSLLMVTWNFLLPNTRNILCRLNSITWLYPRFENLYQMIALHSDFPELRSLYVTGVRYSDSTQSHEIGQAKLQLQHLSGDLSRVKESKTWSFLGAVIQHSPQLTSVSLEGITNLAQVLLICPTLEQVGAQLTLLDLNISLPMANAERKDVNFTCPLSLSSFIHLQVLRIGTFSLYNDDSTDWAHNMWFWHLLESITSKSFQTLQVTIFPPYKLYHMGRFDFNELQTRLLSGRFPAWRLLIVRLAWVAWMLAEKQNPFVSDVERRLALLRQRSQLEVTVG